MITLCGFPISNYYNKAKMAMIEKGITFTEETVMTKSTEEAVLSASPLAKIPFIKTDQGGLCESQAIMDYLESVCPTPPLVPADAFARAKVSELNTFIDWHLEIVARQLYGQAFFGGATLADDVKAEIRAQLEKNIAGFKRLARFSPYLAGDTFTQADIAGFVSLPLVGRATKMVYGEDLLLAGGVNYLDWMKTVGERPSAQKVMADRKAALIKT